jgi:hypothetical protein
MDTIIFLFSCLTFLAYIAVQAIVFRAIRPDRALIWLIKLYFMVEGAALLIGYAFVHTSLYGVVVGWQLVIFSLIAALYIFSVFSYTEASITMRILSEIARSYGKGITEKDIWKRYNTQYIVERRIDRFLSGGDIVKVKNGYTWKNFYSPFIVREKILSFVCLLFGGCHL